MSRDEILQTFFSKDVAGNDVVLVVEQREIWVNKAALGAVSPVFEAMFAADFKEGREGKAVLGGKDFDDILELVQCLFPCPSVKRVNINNVLTLLPLAEEYQIDELDERIKNFVHNLLKDSAEVDFSIMEPVLKLLKMASKYERYSIVRFCVKTASMYSIYVIKQFYDDMPPLILAMMLDLKYRRAAGGPHFLNKIDDTLWERYRDSPDK